MRIVLAWCRRNQHALAWLTTKKHKGAVLPVLVVKQRETFESRKLAERYIPLGEGFSLPADAFGGDPAVSLACPCGRVFDVLRSELLPTRGSLKLARPLILPVIDDND